MAVDFGLALIERHPKSHLSKWMDDLEIILPKFDGHFKSLWMTDHLQWLDLYAYEAWTVLSFLAAKWTTFDIGPMVLGQNYRNPALLAKMGATLQVFSKGRFIMGVGAGWKEDEYRSYDYPFPSAGVRLEQLNETLEILKRMWTQAGQVTFQGKHYSLNEAYCEPKPDPIPKIVVGGGGEKTMLAAARYADWWNLSDANLEKYTERMNILHRHCETIGRDPSSIRKTWFGRMVIGRTPAEIEKLQIARDTFWGKDRAFVGTPAEIVEQLQAYVAVGADYFMLDILGLPNPDIEGMLVEEILPKVKGL
jgi:alkanesulfonate monooxygenase SsuD/methylene tetrahydromethanopterin reductase-like flavin-dependent oxidoreductase (luciferase family)